jgi:beta-lactam-binding protein with PASTA domain
MPNVVGLGFQSAQSSLEAAGVLVLDSIGYFGIYPVSALWQRSNQPPFTVLSQSINSGNTILANTPIVLGVSEPPVGVVNP